MNLTVGTRVIYRQNTPGSVFPQLREARVVETADGGRLLKLSPEPGLYFWTRKNEFKSCIEHVFPPEADT